MTQSNTEELKNARSATTGEKFDSLDERIDCEVDRINKKIDVTMLQQEDKENHVIENTVEGMTTDMVIKGRTLFNHVGKYLKHAGCDWDDNKVTVSGISLNDGYSINFEGTAIDINKSYILGIYIESLNDNAKNLGFSMGVLDNTGSAWNKVESITPVKGWNFVELAFDKSKTLGNIRFRNSKPPTDLELNIVFTNFIMIEKINKYSFIDNPCYFKDFKSFGQQEDKISILSTGKNLADNSIFDINNYDNSLYRIYNKKFKPNTTYTCKSYLKKEFNKEKIRIWMRINEQNIILNSEPYSHVTTTVGKNGMLKIDFYCEGMQKDQEALTFIKEHFNIQFEESSNPTPYEHYKENKKDILLSQYGFDEGLRGFDVTSCDELNSINNKAIKRIEKYIVTGDENWQRATNEKYFFLINSGHKAFSKTLNNKYQDKNCTNLEENGVWSGNAYKFCIKDLSVTTVEEFKTKLKQFKSEGIPLEIYYELSESIEIPLNTEMNTKVYSSKTYVEFLNSIKGTSSFKTPVNTVDTIARLNRENRALEEENKTLRQDFESTTLSLTDSDLELVKQNVDMDFRLMEVEFALDIPQSTLSSNINFKNKKGEVKSMARTPYEMMKIVILSGDYDREDYMHKVGKYYERGRMSKEEHDELMSLMTADEVISK